MAAEKQVSQFEMMDPRKKARLERTIAKLKKRQMGIDSPENDSVEPEESDELTHESIPVPVIETPDSSHLEHELATAKRRQQMVERAEALQVIPERGNKSKTPELAAVTEQDLEDYDSDQNFAKTYQKTGTVNLDSLGTQEKLAFLQNQINILNSRNENLHKIINRKIKEGLSSWDIQAKILEKNEAQLAQLFEKIAPVEEAVYLAELPEFAEQEVTNLAEAGGLTKEQIADLYSDNFIAKLLAKGYKPGNWEKTQALLNAEVKARAAAELAIFNFEFPGVKLDTNGEPQVGFFGKLTGKLNKIKASESYQNYRAFTKLANHILEADTEPAPLRSNTSKLRSAGKIALAATAAAAIGGPVGEHAAEITKHVSDSVNASFVKKESRPEQKAVQAPEITSANFPDVVIAPTNITAQDSGSETRRRRQPLENFTEEELGQAVNFTENEGTEVVDTTASTRRAEARKAQAIKTAFETPKAQVKSTEEDSGPTKPATRVSGSASTHTQAKKIADNMFGSDLDTQIKKPLLKEQAPDFDSGEVTETPIERPSLSISDSNKSTTEAKPVDSTPEIKKAMRAASLEQAEQVAKRITTSGRSTKAEEAAPDQDDEPTTPNVEVATVQSRRGLIDLKPEATETKLPEISVSLGTKSTKIADVKSGPRDQVRTALSEAGKEAAAKIKESLTLRETLRASLKNSGLTKVEQDAYFYTATKKFDSLSKKPAERAKFVAQIQKAADAGVDQLIEMLNQ